MIIEEVGLSDVKKIAEMELKYIYHPYSEAVLTEMLKNPNCLALKAVEDGELVGYISGQFVIDEFNINNVVVRENFRRRGYAESLLNKVIEYCTKEKTHKLYLEVAQTNDAAIKLYQKLGFNFSYERKHYYGGQSALVLVKTL